jgi:hypothetical protein
MGSMISGSIIAQVLGELLVKICLLLNVHLEGNGPLGATKCRGPNHGKEVIIAITAKLLYTSRSAVVLSM